MSHRIYPCRRHGCASLAARADSYCSKRCTMMAIRARQTPEERSRLGRQARAAQRQDNRERLMARVCCCATTLEDRLWLAYQYGRQAKNCARYRVRKGQAA